MQKVERCPRRRKRHIARRRFVRDGDTHSTLIPSSWRPQGIRSPLARFDFGKELLMEKRERWRRPRAYIRVPVQKSALGIDSWCDYFEHRRRNRVLKREKTYLQMKIHSRHSYLCPGRGVVSARKDIQARQSNFLVSGERSIDNGRKRRRKRFLYAAF
jgi:hypothetical protein